MQLLVDATDANTAQLVHGYADEITSGLQSGVRGPWRVGPVEMEIRLWFNPGRDSKKFYGPGIFVWALDVSAAAGHAGDG